MSNDPTTDCPACPKCGLPTGITDGLPSPRLRCAACGHRWDATAEDRAQAERADAAHEAKLRAEEAAGLWGEARKDAVTGNTSAPPLDLDAVGDKARAPAESWGVECDDGRTREVRVRDVSDENGPCFEAWGEEWIGAVLSDTARGAVARVAAQSDRRPDGVGIGWPVVAILAPGERSRASLSAENARLAPRQRAGLDLDAVEARARNAPCGPYLYDGRRIRAAAVCAAPSDGDVVAWRNVATPGDDAACVFFAHAREDVPALVAELRRVRELFEAQSDAFDRLAVSAWKAATGDEHEGPASVDDLLGTLKTMRAAARREGAEAMRAVALRVARAEAARCDYGADSPYAGRPDERDAALRVAEEIRVCAGPRWEP